MSGSWYLIAVVVNGVDTLQSDPIEQFVFPSYGDLLFLHSSWDGKSYNIREVHFVSSDEPGKFLSLDKSSTLRIVEINYGSYYILHVEMQNAEALYLYMRRRIAVTEEKIIFTNVARSLGFNIHAIKLVSRSGNLQ
ncbi:uncharacterized protein LOC143821808 isoform X2 [Paroedura picta]